MIRALICAILLTCSQAQAAWSVSHENGDCLTITWFHKELTKRFQGIYVLYETKHQAELEVLIPIAGWNRADQARFYAQNDGKNAAVVFFEHGCLMNDDGTVATEESLLWWLLPLPDTQELLKELKKRSDRSSI